LTPTSYVVLGLLATLGPSTPYEMEQQVDLSLGHFWSFPHSQLYSEPVRLAERGLVEEAREQGGRRRRTFTLTGAGRTALQDWLGAQDEPPAGTELRDLGLLRLFFGAAARDAQGRRRQRPGAGACPPPDAGAVRGPRQGRRRAPRRGDPAAGHGVRARGRGVLGQPGRRRTGSGGPGLPGCRPG
jgi:DNA-binding PadR family transcriptional regulator